MMTGSNIYDKTSLTSTMTNTSKSDSKTNHHLDGQLTAAAGVSQSAAGSLNFLGTSSHLSHMLLAAGLSWQGENIGCLAQAASCRQTPAAAPPSTCKHKHVTKL